MIEKEAAGARQPPLHGYGSKQTMSNQPADDMGQQFTEGMTVFDAEGDKLGKISEVDPQQQYVTVQKGFLFPKDIYIPFDTIEHNNAEGVYITLSKQDLENERYHSIPDPIGATGRTSAVDATTNTLANDNATRSSETITDGDVNIPVYEEQLTVGKQRQEEGRVRLHKDVVEEKQTITEPVSYEQVSVEKVPVAANEAQVGPDAFVDKDIEVILMGEELTVGKRAVVTEEVRLRKETVTEQREITDSVRKERVVVEGVDEHGQATTERTTRR